MLRVTDVDHIEGHRLYLRFSDGTEGEVDIYPLLKGPVFEPLKELDIFRQFALTYTTLEWVNGADFAPEYLRDSVLQQQHLTVQ